jgi:hypothetical protein
VPRGIKGSGPTPRTIVIQTETPPPPVQEPVVVGTIDLTPSWTFAARVYTEAIRNGSNPQVKTESAEELVKMARTLDIALAFIKAQGLTEMLLTFARQR